jgi:hypothetical protein
MEQAEHRYKGDECVFFITARAAGQDLASIDAFIDGRHRFDLGGAKAMSAGGRGTIKAGEPLIVDAATRAELLTKRAKAFEAWRDGRISEMSSVLDALHWQCRYYGARAVARLPVEQWLGRAADAPAKAGVPRRRFGYADEGQSVASIIRGLPEFKDNNLKPADVWGSFVGELTNNGFGDVREKFKKTSTSKRSPFSVSFTAEGERHTLTYRTFSTTLSRERKKAAT